MEEVGGYQISVNHAMIVLVISFRCMPCSWLNSHNIREVLPQKQVLRQVLNRARDNRFRQSQGVGLDPRLQPL